MSKNLCLLNQCFLVLIIIFITSSCTRRLNLNGIYYSHSAKSTFIFKDSKVFDFQYSFAIIRSHSSGVCDRIDNRSFELNSSFQKKEILLVETKSYSSNSKLYNIKLHLPFKILNNHKILVFLNDSLVRINPVDTLSSFLEVNGLNKIDNIYFGITGGDFLPYRFLDTLYTQKFNFEAKKNNVELMMNYNDSLFNYRVITKEIIKLRRKGLFFNNQFYKKVKPAKGNFPYK
jgi:hypothetical protein